MRETHTPIWMAVTFSFLAGCLGSIPSDLSADSDELRRRHMTTTHLDMAYLGQMDMAAAPDLKGAAGDMAHASSLDMQQAGSPDLAHPGVSDLGTPPPAVPPPGCGNNQTESGEACDGTDLSGLSCATVGSFKSGTLKCKSDCSAYDVSSCAAGKTIQAAGLTPSAVQAAINSASAGDTIVLPAGISTGWSTAVNVNKPVTIQGAGIDQTTITNLQSADVNTLTGGQAFALSVTTTGLLRVTGLTVNGNENGGGITIDGAEFGYVRIDHCKIFHSRTEGVGAFVYVTGLVDHSTFINNRLQVGHYPNDPVMNDSWQVPLTLGTMKSLVMEDNVFEYQAGETFDPWGSKIWSSFENGRGARLTIRHNHWTNNDINAAFYPILDVHGNQEPVSGNMGAHRATRQTEVYENTFTNNVSASYARGARLTYLRGGTIIMFDNVYTGPGFETSFAMNEEDGSSRFNFLSSYPGYDQHWMWLWNNKVNGTLVNSWYSTLPGNDSVFILTCTNLFWNAPSTSASGQPAASPKITSYAPLIYPHPFTTAQ